MARNARSRGPVALALVAASTMSACYTTKINTQVGGVPTGPEFEKRQWFTLAGLVPLSGETGHECAGGVATATSRQSATDILIDIGLSLAGFLVAGSACTLPDNPTSDEVAAYTVCTSFVGGLPPLLLGSRTVTYRCRQ